MPAATMDQNALPTEPHVDGAACELPAPATPRVLWTRPRIAPASSMFSVPVPKAMVPPSSVFVRSAQHSFVPPRGFNVPGSSTMRSSPSPSARPTPHTSATVSTWPGGLGSSHTSCPHQLQLNSANLHPHRPIVRSLGPLPVAGGSDVEPNDRSASVNHPREPPVYNKRRGSKRAALDSIESCEAGGRTGGLPQGPKISD